MVSVVDMWCVCVFAYLHRRGQPITNAKIQFQREVFSPRVLSLVMSFEGTIMLNTEL